MKVSSRASMVLLVSRAHADPYESCNHIRMPICLRYAIRFACRSDGDVQSHTHADAFEINETHLRAASAGNRSNHNLASTCTRCDRFQELSKPVTTSDGPSNHNLTAICVRCHHLRDPKVTPHRTVISITSGSFHTKFALQPGQHAQFRLKQTGARLAMLFYDTKRNTTEWYTASHYCEVAKISTREYEYQQNVIRIYITVMLLHSIISKSCTTTELLAF